MNVWLSLMLFDELLKVSTCRNRRLYPFLTLIRTLIWIWVLPPREVIAELVRELRIPEERRGHIVEEFTRFYDVFRERRYVAMRRRISEAINNVIEDPQKVEVEAEQIALELMNLFTELERMCRGSEICAMIEESVREQLKEILVGREISLCVGRILERLKRDAESFTAEEYKITANLAEAFDLLLEYSVVQLKWFLEKPDEYNENMREFLVEYSDDAQRGILLTVSAILLLEALRREVPIWLVTEKLYRKRVAIVEKLHEIAEELESFTATFQLMRNPVSEEELEIVGSAKSEEELRRLLGLEQQV